MAQTDTEKEASEVLHTLLSVERIEKQEQIIVDGGANQSPSSHSFQSNPTTGSDAGETESQLQWHTPVSISHSLFSGIDASSQFAQAIDEQQVVCTASMSATAWRAFSHRKPVLYVCVL